MTTTRFGPTKSVKVPAHTLRIHPEAQRELNTTKLKRLKQEFNIDAVTTLYAVECEIDGVRAIWIVDGQHRLRAMLELGFGDQEVKVDIFYKVQDSARASKLFLLLNNRISVKPYDRFHNQRNAGEPDAVGVNRIAMEHDLRVSNTTGDGLLACVSSLTTVYNFDEGISLSKTLDTIIAAWGRTAAALEGRVIEGLGIVYRTHNGNIDQSALVTRLAKYPGGPSHLVGNARGTRELLHLSIPRCVGKLVVDWYNKGRRTGKLDPI